MPINKYIKKFNEILSRFTIFTQLLMLSTSYFGYLTLPWYIMFLPIICLIIYIIVCIFYIIIFREDILEEAQTGGDVFRHLTDEERGNR